tara:strand:- start:187 stop:483 length:297 start_codon:yes stop_codon:yes gene_type:complete
MEKSFDERLKEFVREICNDTIDNGSKWDIFDKSKTLKEWLKNHRINKSTFGKIVGISGSTITKYLNNPSLLRITQVEKLAKETKTPIRVLMNLIENES